MAKNMKIEGKLGTASRRGIDCGTLTTDLARTHARRHTPAKARSKLAGFSYMKNHNYRNY